MIISDCSDACAMHIIFKEERTSFGSEANGASLLGIHMEGKAGWFMILKPGISLRAEMLCFMKMSIL